MSEWATKPIQPNSFFIYSFSSSLIKQHNSFFLSIKEVDWMKGRELFVFFSLSWAGYELPLLLPQQQSTPLFLKELRWVALPIQLQLKRMNKIDCFVLLKRAEGVGVELCCWNCCLQPLTARAIAAFEFFEFNKASSSSSTIPPISLHQIKK